MCYKFHIGLFNGIDGSNRYGCMLFISLFMFGVLINQDSSGVLQVVLFMIVIFAEVAWLEIEHIIMKTKMIKK